MRNRPVLMMWTAGRAADAEPMSHTRRQSADLLVPEDQWRSMAACRSADPDLFFPVSSSGQSLAQEAEAKAICAGCPVRRECLAFALRTHQAHGVWGGLSEQERHPRKVSRSGGGQARPGRAGRRSSCPGICEMTMSMPEQLRQRTTVPGPRR